MKKAQFPRWLMVIAAICMGTLFVFPMWRITLYAPQYPEGVTMYIWIDKLGGDNPSVLQNVNILNHYVGMKYIEPDSIPELKYFPYLVAVLIGLALLVAWHNKPGSILAWAILATLLALAGVYDFYLWEYDYGHNLDPKAPMKFPGQSFQPPLFGTKKILNFTAVSLPHTGGVFTALSIFFAYLAFYLNRKWSRS